mgnify:CR=1 FL=1
MALLVAARARRRCFDYSAAMPWCGPRPLRNGTADAMRALAAAHAWPGIEPGAINVANVAAPGSNAEVGVATAPDGARVVVRVGGAKRNRCRDWAACDAVERAVAAAGCAPKVLFADETARLSEVVEPLRRLAMWGIPVFFGFFAGFAASTQWQTTWLWLNGVTTDVTDPIFNLDTGFYMFAMPFYSALLGFVSAVLLVSLLVTVVVSYLYGAVRVGQRELRISKSARIQIAVIAGLYVLVQGVSLWLDRYLLMVQNDDRITRPAYTSANAVIPGLSILAISAIAFAIFGSTL